MINLMILVWYHKCDIFLYIFVKKLKLFDSSENGNYISFGGSSSLYASHARYNNGQVQKKTYREYTSKIKEKPSNI